MKLIDGRELVVTAAEWLEMGKVAALFDMPVYPGIKLTKEYYSRLTPEGRDQLYDYMLLNTAKSIYPEESYEGDDYEAFIRNKKDDPLVQTRTKDQFNAMVGRSGPEPPPSISPTKFDVSEVQPEDYSPDEPRAIPIPGEKTQGKIICPHCKKPVAIPPDKPGAGELEKTQPLKRPIERRNEQGQRVIRFENASTSISIGADAWDAIGVAGGWLLPKNAGEETSLGDREQSFDGTPTRTFTYHVNIDKRGILHADVRNEAGETIYEIKIDDADPDWESWDTSLISNGPMRHKHDLEGLKDHLVDVGFMEDDDILKSACE